MPRAPRRCAAGRRPSKRPATAWGVGPRGGISAGDGPVAAGARTEGAAWVLGQRQPSRRPLPVLGLARQLPAPGGEADRSGGLSAVGRRAAAADPAVFSPAAFAACLA